MSKQARPTHIERSTMAEIRERPSTADIHVIAIVSDTWSSACVLHLSNVRIEPPRHAKGPSYEARRGESNERLSTSTHSYVPKPKKSLSALTGPSTFRITWSALHWWIWPCRMIMILAVGKARERAEVSRERKVWRFCGCELESWLYLAQT